jgi:hypothetical protein
MRHHQYIGGFLRTWLFRLLAVLAGLLVVALLCGLTLGWPTLLQWLGMA